jgi:tRNA pseudouridine38-40 synthase
MRYFIQLSYHGAAYHGWQIQPGALTVQEEVETMLSRILGTPIALTGAGRTDAGVHATGMWAHFDLDQPLDNTEEFLHRCNRYPLPAVAIHQVLPVQPEAHARFSATSRKYIYQTHWGRNPFLTDLSWERPRTLPRLELLNQYAENLLLIQDFASFARSERSPGTDLCALTESRWELKGHRLWYHVRANRFLRNMVRALVGTQLELEQRGANPDAIFEIARVKQRSEAGTSAPAHGLYLNEVTYPPSIFHV